MANTTNLNLYKPTRDDYISVSRDISENMQKIDDAYGAMDTAISNLDESRAKNSDIAIVIVGSTSAKNISVGDYVVVKDSTISGIADGLYTATANVTAGINVIPSNLTSSKTGNGGLNGLNSDLNVLSSKITNTLILNESTFSSGANNFSCAWSNYETIIVAIGNYANIYQSITCPTSEFYQTVSGHALYMSYAGGAAWGIYKNGDSGVTINAPSTIQTGTTIRIWGTGKKRMI